MCHPTCIHEAGHVIVLREEFGLYPDAVTFSYVPLSGATYANIGRPRNPLKAAKFCAYFEAGREALIVAVQRGVVQPSTDVDFGYSKPAGPENDDWKLGLLVCMWGNQPLVGANTRAAHHIRNRWSEVLAVAKALEKTGSLTTHDVQNLVA